MVSSKSQFNVLFIISIVLYTIIPTDQLPKIVVGCFFFKEQELPMSLTYACNLSGRETSKNYNPKVAQMISIGS